jgi:hypothetical protein
VKQRSWFSLVSYCFVTAVAAGLLFAIVIAGASVALASHQSESADQAENPAPLSQPEHSGTEFTGMITDSHCGARHMRSSHQNSAECARACFRRGATYVLVDGDHRYLLIGGDDFVGKLAGERAHVIGTRQGDAIVVDSASPIF